MLLYHHHYRRRHHFIIVMIIIICFTFLSLSECHVTSVCDFNDLKRTDYALRYITILLFNGGAKHGYFDKV